MPDSKIPDRPRLVIVRPDRVGDVIVSSSCLATIHGRWPGAELAWMVRPGMAPLFQDHPRVRKLILLPEAGKFSWWQRVGRIKKDLLEFHADGIVFLHPDSAAQVAAWAAKVPRRLGYFGRWWNWTLTRSLPYRKSEGKTHEARYNFDLLQEWDIASPEQLQGDIVLPAASTASIAARLPWNFRTTSFVILNPSAFSPVARWPVEHFITLAEELLKEDGMHIVLSGDTEEDPSAIAIGLGLQRWGSRILNLAGKTSLGELGALLAEAEALVTRDTGPSHLAAAVGCPVVVIFGRTDPLYGPLRWRPLGEKVEILQHGLQRKRGEKNEKFWKRCFFSITPTEVMQALNRVRKKKI